VECSPCVVFPAFRFPDARAFSAFGFPDARAFSAFGFRVVRVLSAFGFPDARAFSAFRFPDARVLSAFCAPGRCCRSSAIPSRSVLAACAASLPRSRFAEKCYRTLLIQSPALWLLEDALAVGFASRTLACDPRFPSRTLAFPSGPAP
jgi:hypothetical protein